MCVFSVQHGKSYFLLLELEIEALPARVALPADCPQIRRHVALPAHRRHVALPSYKTTLYIP